METESFRSKSSKTQLEIWTSREKWLLLDSNNFKLSLKLRKKSFKKTNATRTCKERLLAMN